uniref:CSON007245 protein n=1 Tax=Culicoides sonorensis TaxID=179676 RepID=A0A336LB32_CULSO
MSKQQSINDQIVELLKPKEIEDPDADDDLTTAKLSTFDEHVESADKRLSTIRKRNVADVTKVDKKYKGTTVTRAELDFDELESSDDDDDADKKIAKDLLYGADSSDEEDLDDDDFDDEQSEDEENGKEENDDSNQKIEEGNDEEENDDLNEESEGEMDDSDEYDDDENDDDDEEFSGEDEDENQSDKKLQKESKTIKMSQILRPESMNDKVRQGNAVKSQLQLWEKLLEMRIKSQKTLTLANSLPFGDQFDKLTSDSNFTEAISSTSNQILYLLDKTRELQSVLVERFPESKDVTSKLSRKRKHEPLENDDFNSKRALVDVIWNELDDFTSNYKPYRNSVIQKWHDRTKIATNVKSLKTMENLNIITKIDNILLNRNELIRKTQIYRGGFEIIGHKIEQNAPDFVDPTEIPPDTLENETANSMSLMKKDTNIYVPEIYDDSDFYHEILRELIEFKTSSSSNPHELELKFQELHQLRNKMKKTVDTRASKGRKIRYVVHNKLVNFMAPVPSDTWSDEAKSELYNSLFDKLLQVN